MPPARRADSGVPAAYHPVSAWRRNSPGRWRSPRDTSLGLGGRGGTLPGGHPAGDVAEHIRLPRPPRLDITDPAEEENGIAWPLSWFSFRKDRKIKSGSSSQQWNLARDTLTAMPSTANSHRGLVRRNPRVASLTGALTFLGIFCLVVLLVGSVWLWQEKTQKEQALELAQAQQRESQRISARLAFDRGLMLCEQGDVARGLLWFTRGLEIDPTDAASLHRAFRANLGCWSRQLASLHSFVVPSYARPQQPDNVWVLRTHVDAWSGDRYWSMSQKYRGGKDLAASANAKANNGSSDPSGNPRTVKLGKKLRLPIAIRRDFLRSAALPAK
jgi:hypothetical protein